MTDSPRKPQGFAVTGDAKEKGSKGGKIGGKKSKGRIVSAETRRKLSESQRARYAKIRAALAVYEGNDEQV